MTFQRNDNVHIIPVAGVRGQAGSQVWRGGANFFSPLRGENVFFGKVPFYPVLVWFEVSFYQVLIRFFLPAPGGHPA